MIKIIVSLIFLLSITVAQEWKHYTVANSGLQSDLIYALVITSDSTIWMGTGKGIVSLKGNVWTAYDTSNSPLPDQYVTSLAVDSSNTLWIGTGFAGAVKFQKGVWTIYDTSNSDIPHNTIFDVTIGPDQSPWFATDDGVVNFKNNVWKNMKTHMIEPRSRSVAFDRQGVLWMGTYDPVDFRGYVEYMYEDSFYHTVLSKLNLISTHPFRIMSGKDSTMYLATGNGLAAVKNGVWTIFHSQDSPLPANGVRALTAAGDTMIIGTASGVAEFVKGSWNVILPSPGKLPNDVVYAAAVDWNGNRWFATGSSGVVVYKKNGIVTKGPSTHEVPTDIILQQNYPNPFNPTTSIEFSIQITGFTTLIVYDVIGREVATLVNDVRTSGSYSELFDATNLTSGIYIARLTSNGKSLVSKLMLMK